MDSLQVTDNSNFKFDIDNNELAMGEKQNNFPTMGEKQIGYKPTEEKQI